MDDIVERLRMIGNTAAEEAADEIERLRSDGSLLAMARNLSEMREEIERLRAECEKAEHEIERLRTELADAIKAIDRLHDRRRELMAECEALRKDAERYRWLRDGSRGNSPPLSVVLENQYDGDELLFDIDLDYVIDRAMASSAEGQEVKP